MNLRRRLERLLLPKQRHRVECYYCEHFLFTRRPYVGVLRMFWHYAADHGRTSGEIDGENAHEAHEATEATEVEW